MKGRRRALQEQAIIIAFWTARINAEAQDGKAKSLSGYLDELLSDDEQAEKIADRFFEALDRQIGAGEVTEQ